MEKNNLEKIEQNNLVEMVDQSGVELGVEKLIQKNNSLLPSNVSIDRIKNSAGFYISNRKDDLMKLDKEGKLAMLYGVLKEAMVGCEAGTDYDIIAFKNKPTIIRNKNGWFKIGGSECVSTTKYGIFDITDGSKFNLPGSSQTSHAARLCCRCSPGIRTRTPRYSEEYPSNGYG